MELPAVSLAWRWTKRIAVGLAIFVAVVGMGSVLAVSLANKFGYQALGMKTGSMVPVIRPGDLVLVRSVNPKSIQVGDIITFRRPGESTEIYTHRVAAITSTSGGGVSFKTKGDANTIRDAWTVAYSNGVALEEVAVIRHGGGYLHVVQSERAREIVALSVFVLALGLLWPIIVGASGARRPESTVPVAGGAA